MSGRRSPLEVSPPPARRHDDRYRSRSRSRDRYPPPQHYRDNDRDYQRSGSRPQDYQPQNPFKRAGTREIKVEPTNVVGIFGLGKRITENELMDAIYSFAKQNPTNLSLIRDKKTGIPKGFAFITFNTVEEATKCIDALRGQIVGGQEIRADYSATLKPHEPTPGIYLGKSRDHGNSRRYSPDRDRGFRSDRRDRSRDRGRRDRSRERERSRDRDYRGFRREDSRERDRYRGRDNDRYGRR